MPYRRLPNTDSARIRALSIASKKGRELPPFKLAFSQGTFSKVQSVLPSYVNSISEHRNYLNLQIEKSKDFQKYFRKLRLYISHFVQVVNMAIQRGELPVNTRKYFNMDLDEGKLPSLKSDQELLHCAQKLIEGEKTRKMEGLTCITNPSIALVQVHYDKFLEVFNLQDSLLKRGQRAQHNLNECRKSADTIIQQIWNEVEHTYKELPEELKREKSSEYGVVYFYRKNETGQLANFSEVRLAMN